MPTRVESFSPHGGSSARSRDAEPHSEPTRVSDDLQAKGIAMNGERQSNPAGQDWSRLPRRPSTSSGISPKTSVRRATELGDLNDGRHFNPLASHGEVMNFYKSPLPEALPTPEYTPISSPPLSQDLPLRSDTPESMDGRHVVADRWQTQIGMALGSPRDQTYPWQPQSPPESLARSPSLSEQPTGAFPRRKGSRWKLFGGLFGGKKQNPTPFYQLQTEQVPVPKMEGEQPAPSERKPLRPRAHTRTGPEKSSERKKPVMQRAHTTPMDSGFKNSERGRRRQSKIGRPMNQRHSRYGELMLDVDIPSVQMERYSVMFGSVLQEPTSTSSSLLARRQVALENLKAVNDSIATKERQIREKQMHLRLRTASSPQPAKSPVWDLFPGEPSRLQVPQAPPVDQAFPLRRSNTSPAAISPARPSFALGPGKEATPSSPNSSHPKLRDHISSQLRLPGEAPILVLPKPQSERILSPALSHLAISTQTIPDKASKIPAPAPLAITSPKPKQDEQQIRQPIASPQHIVSPKPIVSPQTTVSPKPTVSPQPVISPRSILSPPTSPPTPRTHGYSVSISASPSTTPHPTPRKLTRSRTTTNSPAGHPRSPRRPPGHGRTMSAEAREQHLRDAAEVSIARQISVSRQQTRLLLPRRADAVSPLAALESPGAPRTEGALLVEGGGEARVRLLVVEQHRRQKSERAVVEEEGEGAVVG